MGLAKMRARRHARPTRRTSPTARSTRPCWPPTPPRPRCAASPRSRRPSASRATPPSMPWPSWSARRPARGGVLTQCAVEEATNLRLGFKGLTSYSETLSVYAHRARLRRRRRHALVQDVPGRGLCQPRRQDPLHLRRRRAGADGARAGQVDALPRSAQPAGDTGRRQPGLAERLDQLHRPARVAARRRARVMAENLIAMLLGLEVASGNDALASHSEMRKAAKLMLQFIPGTDFITSGYGAIPRPDNMFGGGNFDVDRDGRLVRPAARHAGRRRHRAGRRGAPCSRRGRARRRRLQAVFAALGFPPITDDGDRGGHRGLTARTTCPTATAWPTSTAAQRLLDGPLTVLDVIKALDAAGFADIAANVLEMQRQRVIGDYLQPAAIFDEDFQVLERPHRSQRLPGAGHRLPRRGRALGGAAGPAAGLGSAHAGWTSLGAGQPEPGCEEAGPAVPGKRHGGRHCRRPGVRRRDRPDHRRARPSRRAAGDRGRAARRRASRRGSCASITPPTAPSSATPARS